MLQERAKIMLRMGLKTVLDVSMVYPPTLLSDKIKFLGKWRAVEMVQDARVTLKWTNALLEDPPPIHLQKDTMTTFFLPSISGPHRTGGYSTRGSRQRQKAFPVQKTIKVGQCRFHEDFLLFNCSINNTLYSAHTVFLVLFLPLTLFLERCFALL